MKLWEIKWLAPGHPERVKEPGGVPDPPLRTSKQYLLSVVINGNVHLVSFSSQGVLFRASVGKYLIFCMTHPHSKINMLHFHSSPPTQFHIPPKPPEPLVPHLPPTPTPFPLPQLCLYLLAPDCPTILRFRWPLLLDSGLKKPCVPEIPL